MISELIKKSKLYRRCGETERQTMKNGKSDNRIPKAAKRASFDVGAFFKKACRGFMNSAQSFAVFFSKLPSRIGRFIRALPSASVNFVKNLPQRLKNLWKRTVEEYKYWLYHGERRNKRTPRHPKRAGAIVVALLLCAFALYYIGVYDIAFIERPESWKQNADTLFAIWNRVGTENEKVDSDAADTAQETEKVRDTVQSIDLSSTLERVEKEQKITRETVFKTSDELEAEGYYLTDGVYDEDYCEVGLMTFDFELPEKFTYRNMLKRDWVITEYEEGEPSTVEDTEVEAERPAVYLYMGYIIYDDCGRNLYLLDSGGNVLMEYDENYIPAFARDKSGEPLFYSTYGYYADAPVSVEENEAGEEVVSQTKGVYLTGKKYYSLSYNGNYFVASDYVEERDGRGLNFDFTSDYGITDSRLKRVGILSPKIATFLDGKSALVNFMNWNYFANNDPETPNLEEIIAKQSAFNALPIEEKLRLIEEGSTPADEYNIEEKLPYTYAYNYRENYATVVTDDPEITGEDPKYNTSELRVINTYGEVMFNSGKEVYSTELKDYCSERYLLPLSKGEDSIGHLYFDHGLMRLRKVSYDQFQLEEYKDYRVNSDKDVLVYPNGREFPIPEGYTLKGYSDGILLLEKDGLYGYMNSMGKWIVDPEYTYAGAFHSGVGVIKSSSGVYAAVNTNGDFVLPFNYDYISNRSDGLIAAYSQDKGWSVYGIFTK